MTHEKEKSKEGGGSKREGGMEGGREGGREREWKWEGGGQGARVQ